MSISIKNLFAKQLNEVLQRFHKLQKLSEHDDLSDLPYNDIQHLTTIARAAINRTGSVNSTYAKQADSVLNSKLYESLKAVKLIDVIEALSNDLKKGYLQTIEEWLHGELFADFLEMAGHLLDEGYKDAAAVIAGSTLESHLRQLCNKHNISIEIKTKLGMRPKKADQINSELTSTSVYSKLDQKNVTAWLDLRNKAAHGQYSEYSKEQVSLMVSGIRDFITRNPA